MRRLQPLAYVLAGALAAVALLLAVHAPIRQAFADAASGLYSSVYRNASGLWVQRMSTATGDDVDVDVVKIAGSAAPVSNGAVAANSPRMVEAQPDSGTSIALTAADQSEAAPDIAANANRSGLLIQSAGTEDCLVSVVATTGGTNGVRLAGNLGGDDGRGQTFTTANLGAVYIYDVYNNGLCKFRAIEEVW